MQWQLPLWRRAMILGGYPVVRRDLVEANLLIPSVNTNEYYGQEQLSKMKYIGNVNEQFEDDDSGAYVKFYAPEGHVVYLYNIDLDWIETESLIES
jgi:hypothetical protein